MEIHLLELANRTFMTREEYENLLQSDYWKGYSYSLIKERNFTCEDCGRSFPDKRNMLQVHHLVYRDVNPWSYRPGELVVLCRECHQKRHGINVSKEPTIEKQKNKYDIRNYSYAHLIRNFFYALLAAIIVLSGLKTRSKKIKYRRPSTNTHEIVEPIPLEYYGTPEVKTNITKYPISDANTNIIKNIEPSVAQEITIQEEAILPTSTEPSIPSTSLDKIIEEITKEIEIQEPERPKAGNRKSKQKRSKQKKSKSKKN